MNILLALIQAASRHKGLKLGPEFVMLAGMILIALSMFLLGPSPLIPIKAGSLSMVVIALMLVGLGQSMVSTGRNGLSNTFRFDIPVCWVLTYP